MGYGVALDKSWEALVKLNPNAPKNLLVKFLGRQYCADFEKKSVIDLITQESAKDFLSILILHYLAKKVAGLPALANRWLTFRDLSGVQGYYDAYHKRSIEPIIHKYGKDLAAFRNVLIKLPGILTAGGDAGLILEVFENVPVLVKLWMQDAEFSPDANIYFDGSITEIFCTEDIVVLAQTVALQL